MTTYEREENPMNREQLQEAVRNLLSIRQQRTDTCDQCGETRLTRWGEVGGEPVCQGCIRKHAALVLAHSESLEAA